MTSFPIVTVSFRTESLSWLSTEMSSSRSPLTGGSNDDAEVMSEMGASVVTASNSVLKSVWDFEKIEKRGGPDQASKCWKCGWCGLTLRGWNATKALNHVAKATGNNDVKSCSGSIPKATLAVFQAFRYKKLGAQTTKRQHQNAFADSLSENQQSIAVMLEQMRDRASHTLEFYTGDGNRSATGGGVEASNATKLTSAIAEFVFCKGLSFSSTEGEHFLQILKLSRLVGPLYRPPNRRLLSNDLLQMSYDCRMDKYMTDLAVDADVYGLTLFGDGATVHGMPLMNILASGVREPSAVLAIVDCKNFVVVYCCLLPQMMYSPLFISPFLFSISSF